MTALTLRRGGPADTEWLIERFDEAIAWMVERGQPGQWGTEPMSASPAGRERAAGMCAGGGLRIAELDGEAVAALIVGDAPAHVAPVDRPELYIELLLVSRAHAHRGLGTFLVQSALAEARAAGIELVRVDCWAGAPPLVAWYEAQGFARSGSFRVDVRGEAWLGQVFTREIGADAPATDIQPELWVERAGEAVAFYTAAFGARTLHRVGDGDDIVAQLAVGTSVFWVAAADPGAGRLSPAAIDGASGRVLLVVGDPEAIHARALAAGAHELAPVADEHGWRLGRVRDPFGHEWELGRPRGPWPAPAD
jgi:PhnB protein